VGSLSGAPVDVHEAPRDPGDHRAQRPLLAAEKGEAPVQLLEPIRLLDVAEVIDVVEARRNPVSCLVDLSDATEHSEPCSPTASKVWRVKDENQEFG
jgi:hypothetical protein